NLVTGPFNEPDDELTGIAYRPDSDALLLYNATTNLLQEVSLAAAPIGGPVVAEIPVPDDDPPWVGGIAYDPQGNGGDGEIYAVELSRGIVYRLARDGALLGSFIHPEEVANPTPDPSYIDNYSLGISGVPEVGNGFEELDLSGGSVFERKSTWVRRVDASTGAPSGFQMPTAGIETVNSVRYLALANSDYLGEPVAFVLSVRANDNVLLRVRREPPPVPSISFLRCAQTGNEDRAEISFLNHGPYDAINVERDGSLITTLPGDATSHVDLEATPGRHRYRLTPELGGVTAEPRECELRLGIGALLRRNFVFPAVSPYQMTRDPTDGSFLIAVNTPALSESFFRYDADLTFVATIPSPVQPPWQVAAFAVRPTPSGSEIWSISWEVPAPWLQPQLFELTVQDATGTIIEGPTVLEIPGQPVGVALTYPAAMAHDTDSDTFWFLERNTDLFWRMDTGGNLIASIPHPEPPLQDFVFNLGLAFDPARRSFTATTAGALDQQITRAIGFTPEGILTGEKIFLEEAGIDPLYGIARADGRLWVSGSFGGVGILAELKAADPIAPPAALACVEGAPNSVTLTWDEPVPYDEVVVRRDGVEIAVLPGGTGEHTDAAAANGAHAYTAAGRVGAGESAPSACSLSVTGLDPVFIRGEVTGDGEINLADPILVLGYLFAAGQEPACLDAADADDNGAVNIGDPIWLLTFLFASGLPPLPPFPAPGTDPTPDGLGCG
ncbi:MAG: hypothetical protein ACE5GW_00070, partial [Planctomycetota bacterium]